MTTQNYEEYWKLTLEYTDFNGLSFMKTLEIIVDFIDSNRSKKYSNQKYKELQKKVFAVFPKQDMGSVRKSINQFVKLGFVNFELRSYHENARDFLEARTNKKRQSIFSKIVYTNSSFNRSVTNDSSQREINFLIKTLEENGKLHKKDIIALMTIKIDRIRKGFLDSLELQGARKKAERIGFIKRKYNQVGYLYNLLGKLDDIVFIKDELYFTEDAKNIFGDEPGEEYRSRDPYLHRLYKNQLQEESFSIYGDTKCMLEKLAYPVLIASHIKPFIRSTNEEAYDANNGLLLSKNMDVLFDLGYISFENDGKIILSDRLSKDVKNYLKKYILDRVFINNKRLEYLKYHRSKVLV